MNSDGTVTPTFEIRHVIETSERDVCVHVSAWNVDCMRTVKGRIDHSGITLAQLIYSWKVAEERPTRTDDTLDLDL